MGNVGSIDYMRAYNESTRGNCHVVVYVDHYSRWVCAKAVPRATAKEAAEFMLEDVITKIPKPEILVSDNGTQFVGKLLAKLAEFSQIRRKTTTPYHPQANVAAERVMGVLRAGLAKLSPDQNWKEWDKYLDSVVYSYNTSVSATTGLSPWHIMFGKEPKTAVGEFLVNLEPEEFVSYPEYVQEMARKFVALDERISTSKEIEFRQNRDRLDRTAKEVTYKLDDLVMVRSKNIKPGQGSNKLRPLYSGPHKIIAKGPTGRWFELKAHDKADQTTRRISVDLIKPYYSRKQNDFLDNPLEDV